MREQYDMEQLTEFDKQEQQRKTNEMEDTIKKLQEQVAQMQKQAQEESGAAAILSSFVASGQVFQAEDKTWQCVGQPHIMKDPANQEPDGQQ